MYVISQAVRRDLNEIWDFTAQTWDDEQTETYYRKLVDTFEGLDTGSLRGRPVEGQPVGSLRYAAESHILFFRVSQSGDIEIIRVLHKRMDAVRHLHDA